MKEQGACADECLPLTVRRLSLNDPQYRLLTRVAEELIPRLRSVSKAHLQKSLGFLYRLLQHSEDLWKSSTVPSASVSWDNLRKLSALDWLHLYDRATTGGHTIGFQNFRKQIRILQVLYNRILHPRADIVIPSPKMGGRLIDFNAPEEGEDRGEEEATSGAESATSFGSTGSRAMDEELQLQQRAVRNALMGLRARLCPVTLETGHEEQVYAFNASEVRSILRAAVTTQEQLVVLLFLTTGLRIGGLCRLRIGGGYGSTPTHPRLRRAFQDGYRGKEWQTKDHFTHPCLPHSGGPLDMRTPAECTHHSLPVSLSEPSSSRYTSIGELYVATLSVGLSTCKPTWSTCSSPYLSPHPHSSHVSGRNHI